MSELRFSFRTLSKTPVLCLVVVLSLALGIGANTAIFSLMRQALYNTLPVQRSEEMVNLTSPDDFKDGRQSTNDAGGMTHIFSYPVMRALEANPGAFVGVAGFRDVGANFSYGGKTLSGDTNLVSGQYFPLLGVQPLHGRLLSPRDDVKGAPAAAVLSYSYWSERLGSDPGVLGQPLRVNGAVFTIVGILPPSFRGTVLTTRPDVYVPMVFKPQLTPNWDGTDKYDHYWIYLFARVKPGVSRQQAQDAINAVYTGVKEEQEKTFRERSPEHRKKFLASKLSLEDGALGHSSGRAELRTPVVILMVATFLVLLIAAANAANLLLARGAQRTREISIRTALGAGRRDILRQMMMEAMLLAAAGGAAGLLVALWTLDFLAAAVSGGSESESYIQATLDWRMLLFAVGVSLCTGLLCGLYPAWAASRGSVATSLKEQSGQASLGVSGSRARKVLVGAQVAISVLLLIPMGLFLKSLVNLVHVDLGLRTEGVVVFSVSPELNQYAPARSRMLFEQAEEQLAAIPGVLTVATATVPMIAGNNWGNSISVDGYTPAKGESAHSMLNEVGPGFFKKMGIPLVAGRDFTRADTLASAKVAVVNEKFVEKYIKGGNPVGHMFGLGGGKDAKRDIQIVGVAKNSKYSQVKQDPPALYFRPYQQDEENGQLTFYVRSDLPPSQMVPEIRRVMAGLDRDLPLEEMRTFEEQVKRNVRGERIVFQLAAAFGALATVLAMLGLYGVMAYGVERRTREIGIRMAMGADSGMIRGMVFREVLIILASGLVVGVPAALALARYTESQLFGVKPFDLMVVLSAIAALTVSAFLAGFIPAYRAARISPTSALRYE